MEVILLWKKQKPFLVCQYFQISSPRNGAIIFGFYFFRQRRANVKTCFYLAKQHFLENACFSAEKYTVSVQGAGCQATYKQKCIFPTTRYTIAGSHANLGLFHLHSRQFIFQCIHFLNQSFHFQLQMQLNQYFNR